LESKTLALKLAEFALSKKADNIKILDLRKLTTIADYFVICTAYSEPQVKAIMDAILEGAKKLGENAWHKEGISLKSWVLLDYVDVVVHIFLKETRNFYGLEKLWGDADVIDIKEDFSAEKYFKTEVNKTNSKQKGKTVTNSKIKKHTKSAKSNLNQKKTALKNKAVSKGKKKK
jgi:ribosome-associated protein